MHVRSLLLVLAACAPARPSAQAPAPVAAPVVEPAPSDMLDRTAPNGQPAPADGPAPLQPAAGATIVLDARAVDVVALPGRVVALEPDYQHLRGFDPVTGAELWRTQAQERPNGLHTLYPLGERVLLHAGPLLAIVDAQSGAVVARTEAWHGERCGLRIVRGLEQRWREHVPWDSETVACAYHCECSLQLFDCATGARQQRFNSSVTHLYHSLSQPHDNVCWKPPRLLGRARGRTLAAIEVDDDYRLEALTADATAWQDARLGAAIGRHAGVGGDAGRDVCWTQADDELLVWTCSTGKLRWRARREPQEGHVVERTRLDGDLVIGERRSDRHVVLDARALATGKRLWQRVLAADRALLFAGERPDAWRDGPITYMRIDPATGATLAELTLPKGDALWPDPAGGWVRTGDAYAELDGEFKPRREVARDMSHTTWLGGQFIVQATADRLTVLRRPALDVALAAAGRFAVVESSAALEPGALLLREHRKDEPLRVVLLRAAP